MHRTEETRSHTPLWRAALPGRPLSGLTVLTVEDSRYTSEAVRLLCLRSGARIRRADSLTSAMRHLQTYRPTVALIDIGLPDGNGTELIATLARQSPRVPVILAMSGDPDAEAAAIAAGADGFFAKPVESLASFQRMILQALPDDSGFDGPRLYPDAKITPDSTALKDDLRRISVALSDDPDPAGLDYLARMLEGIARSAHDSALENAARELQSRRDSGTILRLSHLLETRLREAV